MSLLIKKAMEENTANKKLHSLVKNYLDFGFREKNLLKVLVIKFSPNDQKTIKKISKVKERISELFKIEIEKIFLEQNLHEIDSDLAALLLVSMMNGLLLEYLFLNKKINSEIVSNQVVDVFFKKQK
jgi:hypothetical protein